MLKAGEFNEEVGISEVETCHALMKGTKLPGKFTIREKQNRRLLFALITVKSSVLNPLRDVVEFPTLKTRL